MKRGWNCTSGTTAPVSNVEQAMTLSAGHFGLLGMRESAEKIHGRFEVHSTTGQGTTVKVAAENALPERDGP